MRADERLTALRPASNGAVAGSAADDPRVAEALQEYLAELEEGRPPRREQFLARHAAIAEALAPYLDGLELMHAAAPGPGAAVAPEEPGSGTLLGDYRLIHEVGRGGMGVVYEAEQLSLGRRVALKVLPFAATMDARQLQRFQNEARAAASLHHEHIVPVYAVGSERGVHFYAMQFIEGQTLAAFLKGREQETPHNRRTDPLPGETVEPATTSALPPGNALYFRRVAGWGIAAAEALEHAHSLGIVHRDIKPANLLVDGEDKVWVTDFGLARGAMDLGLTLPGDVLGTLRYMSPEQALARHGLVDHRSDVYSLGATLYELLTGVPAVEGEDRQQILNCIATEAPIPPRTRQRAIPRDLETVVLKALAKEPAERYSSARELADDLRRWQEARPVLARRPSLADRTAKWGWRHRRLVAAALVLLLLSVGGLGVSNALIQAEAEARRVALEEKERQRQAAELATERERRQKDLALETMRRSLVLARQQIHFGESLNANGKYKEASEVLRPTLTALATALEHFPPEEIYESQRLEDEAGRAASQLGAALVNSGKWADAVQVLQLAERRFEQVLAFEVANAGKRLYFPQLSN